MAFSIDMSKLKHGTELVKRGFARMQKGGVIMDVTNKEQAVIAEEAGAVAVMALERVPADIRAQGGVARMADPNKIIEIMDAVTIPVMAKCRIGHIAEAEALETLGVDMIDESEVLTPADPFYHVDKRKFTVPFVCGCRELGEATRRIWEGAAMMRTKGEAGTGNVVEAVRHQRMVAGAVFKLKTLDADAIRELAAEYSKSYVNSTLSFFPSQKIVKTTPVFHEYTYGQVVDGLLDTLNQIKKMQRLPVINFAAGGIATPADAAMMMKLGMDGVFVGSGIFKSTNPKQRAKAIVEAVAHYDNPKVVAEVSKGLGEAMAGIEIKTIPEQQRLQERGW